LPFSLPFLIADAAAKSTAKSKIIGYELDGVLVSKGRTENACRIFFGQAGTYPNIVDASQGLVVAIFFVNYEAAGGAQRSYRADIDAAIKQKSHKQKTCYH
jgi:hypothetical protein